MPLKWPKLPPKLPSKAPPTTVYSWPVKLYIFWVYLGHFGPEKWPKSITYYWALKWTRICPNWPKNDSQITPTVLFSCGQYYYCTLFGAIQVIFGWRKGKGAILCCHSCIFPNSQICFPIMLEAYFDCFIYIYHPRTSIPVARVNFPKKNKTKTSKVVCLVYTTALWEIRCTPVECKMGNQEYTTANQVYTSALWEIRCRPVHNGKSGVPHCTMGNEVYASALYEIRCTPLQNKLDLQPIGSSPDLQRWLVQARQIQWSELWIWTSDISLTP